MKFKMVYALFWLVLIGCLAGYFYLYEMSQEINRMYFNAPSLEQRNFFHKQYVTISNYMYVVILTLSITTLIFSAFQIYILFNKRTSINILQWISLFITIIISTFILIGFLMAGITKGGGVIG